MKKVYVFLTILNIVIISAFWYRFTIPIVDSTSNFFSQSDHISSFLAAQANHYSLLQIFLILFSIIIAIAAMWGFTEIKKIVEKKTEEKINNEIPVFIDSYIDKHGQEIVNRLFLKVKVDKEKLQEYEEIRSEKLHMILENLDA